MRRQSVLLRRVVLWSAVSIGSLSLMGGCGLDGNNYKTFRKGNISLEASKNPLGVGYYCVDIGSPQAPYNGIPKFAFELGGQRMLSDQLDVDALRKKAIYVREASKYWKGWRNGEESVEVGPYAMVFRGRQLVAFSASVTYGESDNTYCSMGRADSDKLYRFPLSESQVIEIFGKPDSARSWFSW